MDGLASGALGGRDQEFGSQVALRRLSRTDADRPCGHAGGETVAVGGRDGNYALDTEPMAGPDDTHGDFAPIGDKNAGERRRRHRFTPSSA